MPNPEALPKNVSLATWVAQAEADPIRHLDRQVTEILLHAIGITPELRANLVLKGGILLSLVHGSYRQTGDVDFTAVIDPEPYAHILKDVLNRALPAAAAALGYVDIVSAVQRFIYRPRAENFGEATAPALQLSIGYARRGTSDEERLRDGKSSRVVQVDVSFREKVPNPTEMILEETEVTLQTYSVPDVIAEKLRALLQQVVRNRTRRQDIFDIHWLVERYQPDGAMKAVILTALRLKSADRDVDPQRDSLDDPNVKERARREWETMGLEIGGRLPDFEPTYQAVVAFYRSLPWDS